MLAFAIVAVFVAGLMVGRTPEYLGKKIEVYEMKMTSLMILIPVVVVLTGTAVAVLSEAGRATIYNPRLMGNLLDMTRLESGALKLRKRAVERGTQESPNRMLVINQQYLCL